MYCTWKNTKCRKSKTIISPLKKMPIVKFNMYIGEMGPTQILFAILVMYA